ncbi:hypothetical protein EV421DRAFT_1993927 [Armillaria borealis]|uniref:WD40 repeat-like protein n=1 Tax=Armillaria borealis TaxID=47425 RepID=A0AA39MGE2_9AGAR|nr:hypothetical protein EV421DRAFT_1993927 [Armillaria borealis]
MHSSLASSRITILVPSTEDDTNPEHWTRQVYGLSSRRIADSPLTPKSETSFIGSPISEIKFIPEREHRWLITCLEWSPKGAILTGAKLNADPRSEFGVVVSLLQRIVLLRLDDNSTLHEIRSIDTDLRPVSITGDVIALDNDASKTVMYDWRTDQRAYLDDVGDTQHNHCLRVVFTPATILIVRSRSITLHDSTFTRIATHCFGWVDGAIATSTSILIRSVNDNPWASELNSLELYLLSSFPQTLTSKVSSRCGPLRCTDERATAVWICPHDRTMVSHWEEHDGCETLIAAVFPGPLNPSTEVHVREVCVNSLNKWTAFDYGEDLGRIALGSGLGRSRLFSRNQNICSLWVWDIHAIASEDGTASTSSVIHCVDRVIIFDR